MGATTNPVGDTMIVVTIAIRGGTAQGQAVQGDSAQVVKVETAIKVSVTAQGRVVEAQVKNASPTRVAAMIVEIPNRTAMVAVPVPSNLRVRLTSFVLR